jgi:hypothetical protein
MIAYEVLYYARQEYREARFEPAKGFTVKRTIQFI